MRDPITPSNVNDYNMAPSTAKIHYQNLVQALSHLKGLTNFKFLFVFIATLDFAESVMVAEFFSCTSLAMLPAIVAQDIQFSLRDVQEASIATSTPKNFLNVVDSIVTDPVVEGADYGSQPFKLGTITYTSIGFNDRQARVLQNAIRLSGSNEGLTLFMNEEHKEMSRTRTVVNARNFDKFMDGEIDLDLSAGAHELSKCIVMLQNVFAKTFATPEMATLLAIYFNIDRFTDPIIKALKIVPVSTLPLHGVVAPYGSFTLDQAIEVFDLDMKEYDPWGKGRGHEIAAYAPINNAIRLAVAQRDPSTRYGIDNFSLAERGIDEFGMACRIKREEKPIQDSISKRNTPVSHVDPGAREIRSYVERAHVTKAFMYLSSSNVLGGAINGVVDNVQFPRETLKGGHGKIAMVVSDESKFIGLIKNKNVELVVVDNLIAETNIANDGKTYITHEANYDKLGAALHIIKAIVGAVYDERTEVVGPPKCLVWRTIMPYYSGLNQEFNSLIDRLDSYYDIRYHPPQHPHETQFTIACFRRKNIMTIPFLATGRRVMEGSPTARINRRPSYALRAVDVIRRYHGIVYRQMVFEGDYSRFVTSLVRDVVSGIQSDAEPFDPDDVDLLFNNVNFYPDQLIGKAHEEVIHFLSFNKSASHKKSKRGKIRDASLAFDEALGAHHRFFQGGTVGEVPDF